MQPPPPCATHYTGPLLVVILSAVGNRVDLRERLHLVSLQLEHHQTQQQPEEATDDAVDREGNHVFSQRHKGNRGDIWPLAGGVETF